ncbi:MAG TPA: hypothetical protein VF800_30585 [Telluria sp.]|jgi:hypothetical protein
MEHCYVKLNFPSDLAELGVVGELPDKLPEPYYCIPCFRDQICFPGILIWPDGSPAAFAVANRLFVAGPAGTVRCDLELALLVDKELRRWKTAE